MEEVILDFVIKSFILFLILTGYGFWFYQSLKVVDRISKYLDKKWNEVDVE